MANEDDYQFSLSAIDSAPAGKSVTISVDGNGRPDNWSCSSNAILSSVYANSASVICSNPGVVTITASNDYCTDEITISFYYLSTPATTTMEENSKSTHSVDISIDIDNYSHYYVGQTVSFTYYANDMYGYGTPSDYEISVSGDGKLLSGNCIELTGRGSVCLMITAYQETSSAMIWYKGVEMIDIESMAINLKSPDDSLMYVGSRFKLSYDSPENFRNVTWSSSDESVAEVDSSGYVTIKDYGAAKIYVNAESKYGEKVSDYITILLTSPIVIDLAEPEQSQLHIGESFSAGTVSGDVMYTDWTSDNTSVASVDDSGMITINGPGRVTITVSVEGHYSNYATDSITFFVKNDPEISIVKPSSDLLFVTNEFQIKYKSYFADRILWSSSDTDVAEIDSFGNVSICGTGTVTIKASAYGNGITVNDSVTFAVSKTVPSGAALVPASVKLCPGEKCSLECVNLSDGTTVKYFSDKPEVAEINSGVITAKSLGETVIYAIADGEVFECRVSVCSKKQCSGDVDADGTFSTDDIVALRNYIFGIIEYIDFAAADLDGDGTVSSLDLALLRKMYAQSYNNV